MSLHNKNNKKEQTNKSQGFTLWFTGWSGAGKTSLALALEKELLARGIPHVQRLDGDIVRESLTRGLGFSREDRDENIRRVTFVARMLSSNGVGVLVSFISPYREMRNYARTQCTNFIEIFVDCPREVLIQRDVKGLYEKALEGKIPNFTGISDPYEPPENPEITVNSGNQTLEESLGHILAYLEKQGVISVA